MDEKGTKVTRWEQDRPPEEAQLRRLLMAEGLTGYTWSNAPGDAYAVHSHPFHKVIYVVRGSIVFGLAEQGLDVALGAGDRLDLPAGVAHEAVVGSEGVTCLEAHRSTG